MSKKFLTTPTLPMLPSPPSSYIAGDLYFDTTQNLLGIYTGTAWSYITSGVADNSVTDSKIGTRTINQSYLSATDTDTLNNLLNSLANRIAAITGSANWKNTPATTISELNTNAARKNINEIINGNWTFANNLKINGETQTVSGAYMEKQVYTITSSPQWYRFASSPSDGSSSAALFEIRWNGASSEGHILLYIGVHNNDVNNMALNMLGSSQYSATFAVSEVRVLTNGVNDQMFLELYMEQGTASSPFTIEVRKLFGYGWTLNTQTIGSIPTGYTSKNLVTSNAFTIGDQSKILAFTKDGKLGIWQRYPANLLHVTGQTNTDGVIFDVGAGVKIGGLYDKGFVDLSPGGNGTYWRVINDAEVFKILPVGSTEVFSATTTGNVTVTGNLTVSNTITGTLSGNASTATKLQTARTISLAGDVTGSTSFDGSADASINTSISSVPWNKITSTPTTLSGYGITDAQPLNSKLTSISSLSSTGLIALTSSTATAARTLQGSTGRIVITNPDGVAGNPTIDLATSGVTAGTYTKVTTDAYGRITAGTTLAAADLPAHTHALSDITSGTISLTGDVTGSATLTGSSTVTINTAIGAGVVQAIDLATGASGLNLGVGALSFGAVAWDSLTWTYGYYTVTAGGTGGTGTAPPTTEQNGILQVQYSTGSNIIQTYIPRGSSTGDPAIYVRVYNTSTSSWEAWRKISTPSSAVSLTTQSFTLSSNVTLSTANTWTTIGSLNLSAGTWLVSCVATFWLTATGARNYFARLINLGNNTAFAGSQIFVPSTNPSGGSISLTALVTGGITLTFQGASSVGSASNLILAATTLNSVPATLMTAVKVA